MGIGCLMQFKIKDTGVKYLAASWLSSLGSFKSVSTMNQFYGSNRSSTSMSRTEKSPGKLSFLYLASLVLIFILRAAFQVYLIFIRLLSNLFPGRFPGLQQAYENAYLNLASAFDQAGEYQKAKKAFETANSLKDKDRELN